MGAWRQLGGGFLLGVLSVGLVLGGFALAMAEGGLIPALVSSPTPSATLQSAYPTLELLAPLDGLTATSALPLDITATASNTLPPPPTTCLPPAGWVAISVQSYDTLASIASAYRISGPELQRANCLVSNELVAGSYLYVPPLQIATPIACGAPAGWILYVVQPGDTLYRISLLYRVSVAQLQQANCMGGATGILTGQQLRVPNVVTSTATFTPLTPITETFTPSITLTASSTTGITETSVPTETETPSATSAPATQTPTPTTAPSNTPEPTQTPS